MTPNIPKWQANYYNKGQTIPVAGPGDFMLIMGTDWWNKTVRFGQGLRFGFKNPRINFTHAALVEDESMLIEATGKGIHRAPIEKYKDVAYVYVIPAISPDDRREIVSFARACLQEKYSWVDIISIAFSYLTGTKLSINLDGEEICSGLVARALERSDFIPPRDASHLAPIDLANMFLP